MENQTTTQSKELKKQIRTEIFKYAVKFAAGTFGYILLQKLCKPFLEQRLVAQLTKNQHLAFPIRTAQRIPSTLPKLVPEKVLPEVVTSIQPTITTDFGKPILNGGQPFPVKGGIRNLPITWNASPEKKQLAEALGISLLDHQTLVTDFFKNKNQFRA